jgi:FAD/FMN-containing dehydrogenase
MPAKTTALCAVPAFDAAVALLHRLQGQLGGSLSAFEAMWASYFHYVIEHIDAARSPFDHGFALYVLIETEGVEQTADRERLDRALERALDEGIIVDAVVAQSEREAHAIWAIRDGIGEVTPTLQPLLAFDVSMPVGEMQPFLSHVEREFTRAFGNDVINLIFGHIGDNNLHLAVTTHRERDLRALCEIVYSATGAHSGSVSAEHGVGTLRREYLHHSRTREELVLMTRLKAALDPHGILNPHRVVPE